jgi:alkylation response protein AidB-like acyl-CoA dehydrogenase
VVDLAEFHEELRSTARGVLARTSGAGHSDGAVSGHGASTAWRHFTDLGWVGLEVPEAMGGAGATFAEVALLLEEMGRAASPGPFLGTTALGVGALNLLSAHPGRDALLQQVASGRCTLAVSLSDDDGNQPHDLATFRLETSGGRPRLHGHSAFVPDGHDADRLLIVAIDPDGQPVIVNLEPECTGVAVVPQPVLDLTRRFGALTADGVAVGPEAVWRFAGDPEHAARLLWQRAALSVACDSLGLSEAMLAATVAYACARQQFGQPIGSFQAVKHACANMLVKVAVSRSLVSFAVRQLVGEGSDRAAVSMAKSYVCTSAVEIAGSALQLHGGIGYTWESGVHVYLKRAALNRSLFGSPIDHRRSLAERYLRRG